MEERERTFMRQDQWSRREGEWTGRDHVSVTPYPMSLIREEERVEKMMTVITYRRRESKKWWHMFNKENAKRTVPHKEKPNEGASRPVSPVNHDLFKTEVEIEEDAERPVNQVDQPFTSVQSPGCLTEQFLLSVNEHHYTDATIRTASRCAQEEWVVVLPRRNTVLPRQVRKTPKRSVKAPRRPIVPSSTTPRWKGSKFKQQVGNNTRKRCKSYGRMNTTSCRDRC